MTCLLGIDSGLTVTKAVVFDERGAVLAIARRRAPQSLPRARHVERDMDSLWTATAEAVREALETCGRPAGDIAAVAATAHGDGVYLLGADRRPLGPGILSLDSRAGAVVEAWEASDLPDRALALTGQVPHASAPSALLAWIAENEPERFARIAHILACKDWLRLCLTGTVGTDRTEASTSFADVRTQAFSRDALALYGLADLWPALPEMAEAFDVVGAVTAEAARATGLRQGTPIAAGLHDVTASALGIGAHVEGTVGIVAGTYSINEVVSPEPRTDPRWFCRSAVLPGRWNAMAISPASTANYDWFLETLVRAPNGDASIHETLAPEIARGLDAPSEILFHPYLFGSPHGAAASASFVGLRGWHGRGDMLAAVLEGITFNHRDHVEALADGFAFEAVRLTGGISRNPAAAQLFADVLKRPVTVTDTEEAAAWGAALCAGAGIGLFASPLDDPRDLASQARVYRPDPEANARRDTRYALYTRIGAAMAPLWPEIGRLGAAGEGAP